MTDLIIIEDKETASKKTENAYADADTSENNNKIMNKLIRGF